MLSKRLLEIQGQVSRNDADIMQVLDCLKLAFLQTLENINIL